MEGDKGGGVAWAGQLTASLSSSGCELSTFAASQSVLRAAIRWRFAVWHGSWKYRERSDEAASMQYEGWLPHTVDG